MPERGRQLYQADLGNSGILSDDRLSGELPAAGVA